MDLNPNRSCKYLGIELLQGSAPEIEKQMTVRRRGQEMKLVICGLENKQQNTDPSLIALIAKPITSKPNYRMGQ